MRKELQDKYLSFLLAEKELPKELKNHDNLCKWLRWLIFLKYRICGRYFAQMKQADFMFEMDKKRDRLVWYLAEEGFFDE